MTARAGEPSFGTTRLDDTLAQPCRGTGYLFKTDTEGDHGTWDPGVLLASSDAQSTVPGGATLSTFTFAGQPVLADNTVYAFTYTDGVGTRVNARMGLTNASAISDGTLFSGSGQVFGDAFDTAMQITTVVPEPSTFALIGLAAMLLVARRRM